MREVIRLIQDIRGFLTGVPGASPAEALAPQYAWWREEAANRLEACAAMLEKGSEYQALQLAEADPPLLDLVAELVFAEEPEWVDYCHRNQLTAPSPLDSSAIRALIAVYDRGISPNSPFYRDYRSAVSSRDDDKALQIVRTIVRLNPTDASAQAEKDRMEEKNMRGRLNFLKGLIANAEMDATVGGVDEEKAEAESSPEPEMAFQFRPPPSASTRPPQVLNESFDHAAPFVENDEDVDSPSREAPTQFVHRQGVASLPDFRLRKDQIAKRLGEGSKGKVVLFGTLAALVAAIVGVAILVSTRRRADPAQGGDNSITYQKSHGNKRRLGEIRNLLGEDRDYYDERTCLDIADLELTDADTRTYCKSAVSLKHRFETGELGGETTDAVLRGPAVLRVAKLLELRERLQKALSEALNNPTIGVSEKLQKALLQDLELETQSFRTWLGEDESAKAWLDKAVLAIEDHVQNAIQNVLAMNSDSANRAPAKPISQLGPGKAPVVEESPSRKLLGDTVHQPTNREQSTEIHPASSNQHPKVYIYDDPKKLLIPTQGEIKLQIRETPNLEFISLKRLKLDKRKFGRTAIDPEVDSLFAQDSACMLRANESNKRVFTDVAELQVASGGGGEILARVFLLNPRRLNPSEALIREVHEFRLSADGTISGELPTVLPDLLSSRFFLKLPLEISHRLMLLELPADKMKDTISFGPRGLDIGYLQGRLSAQRTTLHNQLAGVQERNAKLKQDHEAKVKEMNDASERRKQKNDNIPLLPAPGMPPLEDAKAIVRREETVEQLLREPLLGGKGPSAVPPGNVAIYYSYSDTRQFPQKVCDAKLGSP